MKATSSSILPMSQYPDQGLSDILNNRRSSRLPSRLPSTNIVGSSNPALKKKARAQVHEMLVGDKEDEEKDHEDEEDWSNASDGEDEDEGEDEESHYSPNPSPKKKLCEDSDTDIAGDPSDESD